MEVPQAAKALEKLDSFDADLRFMGLSDLAEILASPQFHQERSARTVPQIRDGVVARMSDSIAEVQAQAVKTLGALVQYLDEKELLGVLNSVLALQSVEIRDQAVRTVVAHMPQAPSIVRHIVDKVLQSSTLASKDISVDSLSVYLELVSRYGYAFSPEQISTLQDGCQHLLGLRTGMVAKKAAEILVNMVQYMSDDQWRTLADFLAAGLNCPTNPSLVVVSLLLVANLCTAAPDRLETLDGVYHVVAPYAKVKDEESIEVTEAGLTTIEGLVSLGLTDKESALQITEQAIKYRPNDAGEDDRADGDGSDFADSDLEFSQVSDYDDDLSWKIRRYGARVAASVMGAFPDTVAQLAPLLLQASQNEHDGAVKKEFLKSLITISTTHASDLVPFYKQIADLAAANITIPEYLDLLTNICDECGPGKYTDESCQLALARTHCQRPKQLDLALKFTLSIITHSQEVAQQSVHSAIDAILLSGLRDNLYTIQSTALKAVQLMNASNMLSQVLDIIETSKNVALKGQALRVAAALTVASANTSNLSVVVTQQVDVIKNDTALRLPALQALTQIAENVRLPEQSAELAILQVTDLLNPSSRMVTLMCLHALCLLTPMAPESKGIVAARVLDLQSDVQFSEVLCQVLSATPSEPGVEDFAFSLASSSEGLPNAGTKADLPPKRGATKPVVQLFGALAASKKPYAQDLLDRASESSMQIPIWANIISEIITKGDLPNPPLHDFTDWPVLLVAFLATKDRIITSVDSLLHAASSASEEPDVLGSALGVLAAKSGQTDYLFDFTDSVYASLLRLKSLEAFVSISDLNDLRTKYEQKLQEAISKYTGKSDLSDDGVHSLAHIIGTLIDLTGSLSILTPWSGSQVALYAAKFVYEQGGKEDLNDQLMEVFMKCCETSYDEAPMARLATLNTVTWATQKYPHVATRHLDSLLPIIFGATVVDPRFIRDVQVGPFKHKIDEGLGLRKAAFEALYTIVSSSPSIFSDDSKYSMDILRHVLSGFSDDHDIQLLCCQTLNQLAASATKLVASKIPLIKDAFTKVLAVPIKENSVKQEHDKKAAISKCIASTSEIIKDKMAKKHLGDPGLLSIIAAKR